jgi:two-component system chemotaxis sensor kinase CheA
MDEVLQEFLAEMAETLDAVDLQLVRFEANPEDRGALDGAFRLMHTLKGTAGFVGLPRLEALAHAGEDLMVLIRERTIAPSSEAVSLVLGCIDQVKALIAEVAGCGTEPQGEDAELIARIQSFALTAPRPVAAEAGETALPASPDPLPGLTEPPVHGPGAIRISVDLLETLLTMVTDLVLTRNQLLQLSRLRADDPYLRPLQRLSSITSEVQDVVMRMRMQPIGAAWKNLPRLVRDIAADLGKDIRLVMEGEAAELDRQVLDSIKDPLTHMVRNAADHGLETPAERLAAGKPEAGTITLSAQHQGGYVIVRIADDGRGLDTEAIRAKAVEKGLLTPAEAEELAEAQVHRLIFAAGFSTAKAVTSLSGRGVGMDVVRANIEEIGGQVDLVSTPGAGTVISLRIPLTLAIISSLIVTAEGRRFAAPQAGVSEVVRVGERQARRIETVEGAMLLRLRETLLPVVSLSACLELAPCSAEGYVLVMQSGARRFGLLVDGVEGVEEIVVKPLPPPLRGVRLLSGATMLGDGSVALILNGDALGERAEPGEAAPAAAAPEDEIEDTGDRQALLLFRAGDGGLKAAPLAKVARLERVPAGDIEIVGAEAVLQLRGELLPVLSLDGRPAPLPGCEQFQPLLILAGEEGPMALAVERIIDVVQERLEIELASSGPGVLGAAVVAGEAVEVLDLDYWRAAGRRTARTKKRKAA